MNATTARMPWYPNRVMDEVGQMEKQALVSIQSLLPAAILWAEQAEREILATGIPLVAPFLDDAQRHRG